MVSRNGDTEAYTFLLQRLVDAVERHAHDLVGGAAPSLVLREGDKTALLQKAAIVAEDGFRPPFMMIDGDNAERRAIEQVWPGLPIRVCQFHVMQSVRIKATSVFGNSQRGRQLVDLYLKVVRDAQRCRIESQWPEFRDKFEQEVLSLCENNAQRANVLTGHMANMWFSPTWRRTTVDYGMPPSMTRDSPWSTNNYAESIFRTFDRVFLNCRANKR